MLVKQKNKVKGLMIKDKIVIKGGGKKSSRCDKQ